MAYNTDIFDDNTISSYAKYLYLAMSKYADKQGECYPSLATLANVMGVSETTVKKYLPELEQSGWIVKNNRFKGKMKTSNLYIMPWLKKKRKLKNAESPVNSDRFDTSNQKSDAFQDNTELETPVFSDSRDTIIDSRETANGGSSDDYKLIQLTYPSTTSPTEKVIENGAGAQAPIIYNGSFSNEKAAPPILKIPEKILSFTVWYRDTLYKEVKKTKYIFTDDVKQCISRLNSLIENVSPAKEKLLKDQARHYLTFADDCSLTAFCDWLERKSNE